MIHPVPDLLIASRLLAPIVRGMEQLNEIRIDAADVRYNSVLLKGVTVLAVAAVENAVVDSLRYYYAARPGTLGNDPISVEPRNLWHAARSRDILQQFIDHRLRKIGYESFTKQLERYTKVVQIEGPDSDLLESFIELKETRNLIVHSDMRATEEYIARSGTHKRVDGQGELVPISHEYLLSRLITCHSLLDLLRSSIADRYSEYSRVAAIRRLWAWMFRSPVMGFDDFWVTDEEADEVAYRDPEVAHLANSEQIILSLWLTQVRYRSSTEPLTMYSLDVRNRRKVSYFLSILDDFPLR